MTSVGGGAALSGEQADVAKLEAQLAAVRRLAEGLRVADSVVARTEAVYASLVDAVILDVAVEVHRSLARDTAGGAARASEGEGAGPVPAPPRPRLDAFGAAHPPSATESLNCPLCGRPVAAGRFAPHLEKCFSKGRAASARGGARKGGAGVVGATAAAAAAALAAAEAPAALAAPPPRKKKPRKEPAAVSAPAPAACRRKAGGGGAAAAANPHELSADLFDNIDFAGAAGRANGGGATKASGVKRGAGGATGRARGAVTADNKRRRVLRSNLAKAVTFSDLQDHAQGLAAPRPAAAIREAATGFRQLAESEEGGPVDADDTPVGDLRVVMNNICGVESQRDGSKGRICANGINCSQHNPVQRMDVRSRIFVEGMDAGTAGGLGGDIPPGFDFDFEDDLLITGDPGPGDDGAGGGLLDAGDLDGFLF